MTETDIINLIEKDSWMIEVLKTAKTLQLPDWWIGAGFVRSKVWDHLHHYSSPTALPDVDVIYFDKNDFSTGEADKETTSSEIKYEQKLKKILPEVSWSVTNQARMHLFHHHPPYQNSTQALSKWTETATCIAVSLDSHNRLILTCPHGISDLVNLILRPVPDSYHDLNFFHQRITQKKWLEKWPKLKVVV